MKVYQLVVPADKINCTALARVEERIKRARQIITKAEGVGRRDLAVIGPRYMFRSGRMVGLVYRLCIELAEEIAVVEPRDVSAVVDPWTVEAKDV